MSVPNTAGRIVRNGLSWEKRGFTRLPNDWVRDRRISYRALGIITYLMSHEEGWSQTIRDLAASTREPGESRREGLSAVRAALKDLERYGYVTREQQGGKGGAKFGGNVWTLSDPWENGKPLPVDNSDDAPAVLQAAQEPVAPDLDENPSSGPLCDFPSTGFPSTGFPSTEFPSTGFPSTENRTTTEEHSPEEHHQQINVTTPTGHVLNASTEARSAASQVDAARCSARAYQAHLIDSGSGYCVACAVRVHEPAPIGATA